MFHSIEPFYYPPASTPSLDKRLSEETVANYLLFRECHAALLRDIDHYDFATYDKISIALSLIQSMFSRQHRYDRVEPLANVTVLLSNWCHNLYKWDPDPSLIVIIHYCE